MERRRPRRLALRPLVLIVDDHEDSRELYMVGLAALGFETMAVDDGSQAHMRAWELHPDIIVTELPMRNGDAWDFLQRLKQDPRTRDIPVVVVSGYVEQSLRECAEHDGFAAFFAKPCLPEELAAGLRQVLDAEASNTAPPDLFCPKCGRPLMHRETVMGGVKPVERWDYLECRTCGQFVYRDRTRKLRPAI